MIPSFNKGAYSKASVIILYYSYNHLIKPNDSLDTSTTKRTFRYSKFGEIRFFPEYVAQNGSPSRFGVFVLAQVRTFAHNSFLTADCTTYFQ